MNLVDRLTFERIKSAMARKGHPFFTRGDYNLNLIGIRAKSTKANRFDDAFCVLYYLNGQPRLHVFKATTDPGLYYLEHPLHKEGCAVMLPGHHKGLWKIGNHRGVYRALVQKNPVYFYRDNDRDRFIDAVKGETEYARIGLNCHRANKNYTSTQVDKWSAGCQVIADPTDFALLLQLCEISAPRFGNSFSYTLLREGDLL